MFTSNLSAHHVANEDRKLCQDMSGKIRIGEIKDCKLQTSTNREKMQLVMKLQKMQANSVCRVRIEGLQVDGWVGGT